MPRFPNYKMKAYSLKNSGEQLVATLFEVNHYRDEYQAPASTADIAFELGATTPQEHRTIVRGVKKGLDDAKENLSRLKKRGLVANTKHGGWIVTPKGTTQLRRTRDVWKPYNEFKESLEGKA